ncbi:MAG: cytochrome C [Bdellovibrionales bacterium GWB1_55_8]|nr:MAG: cytochrome C [Bdellovibrionales bacterium GWB1_55_8]
MTKRIPIFIALAFLPSCNFGSRDVSSCTACHQQIEKVSDTHPNCVSCHGGNDRAAKRDDAHASMFAKGHAGNYDVWEKTCGACHVYQLARMQSNLMFTAAGMIGNIQSTWEGELKSSSGTPPPKFSSRGGGVFDGAGNPVTFEPVTKLENLSGELFRKFCSSCHVGAAGIDSFAANHASGCGTCHFPYNATGTYAGSDKTMQGRGPFSATHAMEKLPGNDVCLRCHDRSGRIGLSYTGLYDGNNGMVPTRNGQPGPVLISGRRNATHIAPDAHFAAGMDCIDCHTSRDTMGDGYSYSNMYLQTEISCEDCHGSAAMRPKAEELVAENDDPVRESRSYRVQMRPGNRLVLTAKGRKYSNVFETGDGKIVVLGKRTGKLFTSKVITKTPEHTIVGHERMACNSCHSRAVVQCYGCHTKYDQRRLAMDPFKGMATPGAFSETEDYRTLYPFPLAMDQRGKVSTVTPGCQTFITVIEKEGGRSKHEYVANYKGKPQLRFAPFFSHNTGKKAVSCSECHGNPAFLGFGQHIVEGAGIRSTLLCERSDEKPLDGFMTLKNGNLKAFSAITRETSRPLSGAEVKRVFSANLCIVCHDKASDPIYRKELDYRALDDTIHRKLLR